MEKLFELHDAYISRVPMEYIRDQMGRINWDSRLIGIKGPKGVGKSTLIQQYIKKTFGPGNRHALYCSADASYFTEHTLTDTAAKFVREGGTHLFIDEIHKYDNWSRELKEIYDLYSELHVVVSGSSLIRFNDGQADLSRRLVEYEMPGLSFREYLWFEIGARLLPVSLDELLAEPAGFCLEVRNAVKPLEHFKNYLRAGYYPFYYEERGVYQHKVQGVVNYIIESELTAYRGLEAGNTRKVKALLQVLSQIVPFQVDISKISRNIGIQRPTTLKYMMHLEEAKLIRRLFTDLESTSDLQKPDKILLDNPNLIYTLSSVNPEIGTVRESFFCNQLSNAGHRVEYGGLATGDFRIDRDIVVEVGGEDKGFRQVKGEDKGYVAADDIESAVFRKIPLWAFGFLY
ncbi:MAG: AAA family ATPase [Bacteroidales bacterium]|nr:AAA family ATPase [Bacteroidales bacterium]MBR0299949.1 AAA family ATPase [Bacteroidales bacterium]